MPQPAGPQVLPELGTAPVPAGPASGARFALFEAVCAVLDRASRSAPLVVILDDLHAAGRPSALLLRFAASVRLSRVLLLATYRTAEAAMDPDVGDVITTLESVSPPLILAGLSSDDIRLMLPGADADVLAVVQRRGEGNPLFVSQVARLLGQGAATVEEMPVPAGIRQAVRRQVAGLGGTATGDGRPAAGIVLATAAALGPGIDPALVADVLGAASGVVAGLCDRATEIGLLGPGLGADEVYRFRHALIRETLYGELTPQSRAQAHHTIAEVLETRPGRSSPPSTTSCGALRIQRERSPRRARSSSRPSGPANQRPNSTGASCASPTCSSSATGPPRNGSCPSSIGWPTHCVSRRPG